MQGEVLERCIPGRDGLRQGEEATHPTQVSSAIQEQEASGGA